MELIGHFNTVSTSPTMGWKNVNKEVDISIAEERPGMLCIRCQWNQPKNVTSPANLPSSDSVYGVKNAHLRNPSQSGNNDGYSCTGSSSKGPQQQETQLLPVFGAPSTSVKSDTPEAGLAQAPVVFVSPVQPSTLSPCITFGTFRKKSPQHLRRIHTGSSVRLVAFPTDESSNVHGFQNSAPRVNIASGTSSSTSNQPVAEKETMEYVAGLTISQKQYTFKASFTKSNCSIVGSFALTQIKAKSVPCSEIDKLSKEFRHINGIVDKHDFQLPSAVWVNVEESEEKNHNLKFSNSDHGWVSDNFNGSFACFTSTTAGSSAHWLPLKCLIYIKFETSSVGEKKALKQLTDLYVEQTYCDVRFSLKGDLEIGGHRNILAARSPVFAAMFQHNMNEAITGQVNIEDSEPDIFKQLLYYIYSGKISTPLTDAIAQPLFVVADKYGIEDLKEACATFLLTCVTMDNVIGLLVWSHLHSIDALVEVTLTFMAVNGKDICGLNDWEELVRNYPDLSILAIRRIMSYKQ